MNRICLDPTERSPQVDFDFPQHRFSLRGESYPEDAAAFFGPLIAALRTFLEGLEGEALTLDLQMAYFNSSSAKALMNMFILLEDAARRGNAVTINWHYRRGDDTMEEFGEDFAEDFSHAAFNLRVQE